MPYSSDERVKERCARLLDRCLVSVGKHLKAGADPWAVSQDIGIKGARIGLERFGQAGEHTFIQRVRPHRVLTTNLYSPSPQDRQRIAPAPTGPRATK